MGVTVSYERGTPARIFGKDVLRGVDSSQEEITLVSGKITALKGGDTGVPH